MNNKVLIIEKRQLLTEEFWENVLLAAGFIPVVGEIFDIISIIRYLRRGEYLYAALMLIALIPTVGDIVAKPFIKLLKGFGDDAVRLATKNSDNFVKFLNKNPKVKEEYLKQIPKFLDKRVDDTIEGLRKVPILGKQAHKLENAVQQHKSILTTLLSKPNAIGKSIGREISAGVKSPVGKGITNYFRNQELKKYIIKNGHEPATWISRWWNVVYGGYHARRNYIKQFIISNGILDMFGLPSFDAFQRRVENDSSFRDKLSSIPIIGSLVQGTTTPEDLARINGDTKQDDDKPNIVTTLMTAGMLKAFAKKYV